MTKKKDKDDADQSRIDLNDPQAIYYWTQRFFVTEERLRQTVGDVGVAASDVAKVFGKPFPLT